jgi:hypothetical protein
MLANVGMEFLNNLNSVSAFLKECLTMNFIPMKFKEIVVAKFWEGFLVNKIVAISMPSFSAFFFWCVIFFTVNKWEVSSLVVMDIW